MNLHIISVNGEEGVLRRAQFKAELAKYKFNCSFYINDRTIKGTDSAFKGIKQVFTTNYGDDYLLFAEDDLILQPNFSTEKLEKNIKIGLENNYDFISTGSWETFGEKLDPTGLVNAHRIRGTQLMIIYKSAFDKILEADDCNYFDNFISFVRPAFKIGLIVPFLSRQRTDIPSMLANQKESSHNLRFISEEARLIDYLNKNLIKS